MAEGIEVLELWLEGKSDEVRAHLFVCLIAALTRGSSFRSHCKFLKTSGHTAAQCTRTPHTHCLRAVRTAMVRRRRKVRSAGSLDAPS